MSKLHLTQEATPPYAACACACGPRGVSRLKGVVVLGKLTVPACSTCCDGYTAGSTLPGVKLHTALTSTEVFDFLKGNYAYHTKQAALHNTDTDADVARKYPRGIRRVTRQRMEQFDDALGRIISSGQGLFKVQPYIACTCKGSAGGMTVVLLCIASTFAHFEDLSSLEPASVPLVSLPSLPSLPPTPPTPSTDHYGFYNMFQALTMQSVYAHSATRR